MIFTEEALGKIAAILDAKTESLVELMRIAGLDPLEDLAGADFKKCDFGEEDVTGWNLCGTDLTDADLSRVQNILEAKFSTETIFAGTKLPVGITVEILLATREPSIDKE